MASLQVLPSGPPALPQRNPRRRLRGRKLSQLTDEQHDLWEHAALLQHGYEWQGAATAFQYLAHTITGESESNLCLLNAALLFARLGDFSIAAETLDGGGQTKELLSLTLYLMGHIELELKQNIEKARDCFTVALKQLEVVGGTQSYHHLGLEFTLYAVDLRVILEMLDINAGEFVSLKPGAIAVNGIFEAPHRSWNESSDTIDTMNPNVLPSSFSGYSSDGSSTRTGSPSRMSRFGPRIVSALRTSRSTSSFKVFKNHLISDLSLASEIPRTFNNTKSSLHRRRNSKASVRSSRNIPPPPPTTAPVPPIPALPPPPIPALPPAVIPSSYPRRLSQSSPKFNKDLPPTPRSSSSDRMVPRDARPIPESTSTLASFIKSLPSQNALEPREAEGDFGPMREMTDFLRGTAPSGERSMSPAPLRRAMSPAPLRRTLSPAPLRRALSSAPLRRALSPAPLRSHKVSSMSTKTTTRSSSSPPSSVSSLGSRSATPPPPPSSLQRSATTSATNPAPPPPKSALRYARSAASAIGRSGPVLPPKELHPALRPGFRLGPSTIGTGMAATEPPTATTTAVGESEGDIPVVLAPAADGRLSPVSALSGSE